MILTRVPNLRSKRVCLSSDLNGLGHTRRTCPIFFYTLEFGMSDGMVNEEPTPDEIHEEIRRAHYHIQNAQDLVYGTSGKHRSDWKRWGSLSMRLQLNSAQTKLLKLLNRKEKWR